LEKGDKLRAFYQLRALSKQHDVYLVSIGEGEINMSDLEKVRPYTQGMYLANITPTERFVSLFRALFNGMPFQIAWFFSRKIQSIIKEIHTEIKPDHIYCQLPRMVEYAKVLGTERSLDYMDCFGIGMQRRASVATGLVSWLYKLEAERMLQYEKVISHDFKNLMIISDQDKKQFKFDKASEIIVVPNGIDKTFFYPALEVEKEYDVVFIGNMAYLPNIEAAEYLVRRILPFCKRAIKVLIAGASPSARVRNLASEHVTIKGWVDDIRTAYTSGKLFVAPMFSGTGQQNKILEAMALGVPCLTTGVVNNAIGAEPGKSILLAETPEQFANEIERVLSYEDVYSQIRDAGKLFIENTLSWEDTGTILSTIFARK
jgi:glycosyltransferase involved in cell wall biosynthesis